jgi:hypothetical protein
MHALAVTSLEFQSVFSNCMCQSNYGEIDSRSTCPKFKIYKERTWELHVFRYGLHLSSLFKLEMQKRHGLKVVVEGTITDWRRTPYSVNMRQERRRLTSRKKLDIWYRQRDRSRRLLERCFWEHTIVEGFVKNIRKKDHIVRRDLGGVIILKWILSNYWIKFLGIVSNSELLWPLFSIQRGIFWKMEYLLMQHKYWTGIC